MSNGNISYEKLRERLARAEATLRSLRHGEVDLVIGSVEPLVVRFKSVFDEKERFRALLDIVRRINQLIIHEDDRRRLLQSAADCLCQSGLFDAARIVQFDESGKTLLSVGSGDMGFKGPNAGSEAETAFPCLAKLIESSRPMVIADPAPVCDECAAKGCLDNRCLIAVPLNHDGELFGMLIISAPRRMARQTDAHRLCAEIGGDLGFALYRIRMEASQRKAQTEHARLIAAIEQVGEAVVVTDPEGTIGYVNPAFESITGYSRTDAIGRNPRLLKSGEQDDAFYQNLWLTITSGRTWHGRMVNKRKDGTLYTEEATISPVRDISDRIVNYVAVKRDITEQLRVSKEKDGLKEQLWQAQKLESMGRLAGGVAHDFNNMLTVILGYGEGILSQLPPGDPLRDDANEIVAAAKRSAALTRQLLAFSRRQRLQPKVLNPNDLLTDLEKMLRRLIGEDIDIVLALADDLALVSVDPGQFDQIIINLAVNARDAMPAGGKLTIETTNIDIDELYAHSHADIVPGQYVVISVTDSGYGLDKETLSHVFDPFFTTKKKEEGTGLGLSIVYGIVKQSGGDIWVYSEPGLGTTVKIYLPQTDTKPQVQDVSVRGEERFGRDRPVLVVEDEAPVRELLRGILSKLGFRVVVAANGSEALLLVEEEGLKPDLLITDVVMPKMSGAVLAERLRGNQPDLKVLFMSGYTGNAVDHHAMLDSGTPFMQKPFTLQNVVEKVRAVLHGGPLSTDG